MPNIQENITRIQGAKSSLKTSIQNKGVTIPDDALIDTYYSYVDQIQTGSSSGGSSDYDSTMEDKHFTINNDNGWPSLYTSVTLYDRVASLPNSALSNSQIIEIEIPDSVTSLGFACFADCNSLSSVTIGSGVTQLPDDCFRNCFSLSVITIPDRITSLGVNCFYNSSSLSSIIIPDSVTSLGDYCFQSSSLSSVTIGSGVTQLPTSCFSNSNSLSSITIPDWITSLGVFCFFNSFVLSSVTIGSGVTSLGESCFNSCYSLSSITCLPTVPPTSGGGMFDSTNNCPIYVPNDSVTAYKSAWSDYADRIHPITDKASLVLTYYSSDNTFPICTDTGISCIDYYMVDDDPTYYDINTASTENIFGSFLGRTHTFDSTGEHTIYFYLKGDRIENSLFLLINSLKTVKINSSVKEIGSDNFANGNLNSVIIGENVEKIDNGCFQNNSYDFTLECLPTTPPILLDQFSNTFENCSTIYVPDDSVTAYKTASGWSTYDSKIQPLSSKPE